jgi:hypothetical protein
MQAVLKRNIIRVEDNLAGESSYEGAPLAA